MTSVLRCKLSQVLDGVSSSVPPQVTQVVPETPLSIAKGHLSKLLKDVNESRHAQGLYGVSFKSSFQPWKVRPWLRLQAFHLKPLKMGATLIGQLEESADKLQGKASIIQALVKKKKNKHKYYVEHVKQACAKVISHVSVDAFSFLLMRVRRS